jgi:hypothetical protein
VSTLESQVDRGVRAERILNDPLVIDAFQVVAASLHAAWEAAPIRDKEGQHELKLMLKLLTDVKSYFDLALSDGQLAAAEIRSREESKQGYSPAQWKREYYGY